MKNVLLIGVLLLLVGGCGAQMTQENPFGIADPNQVQMWISAAVAAGQTSQALGLATGNPAMIGYGAALVLIGGWITSNVLKGKKNGES